MDRNTYDNHAKAWAFIEEHEADREGDLVREARAIAEANGLPVGSAAEGALLNTFARLTGASSIIVVGTGALVETAQLATGLDGAGKLTAVDSSAQGAAMVRALFDDIADRTRTTLRVVNADPSVYLPRLNGDDYNLIVVGGEAGNYAATYEQAPRLLKRGGVLVFTNALAMRGAQSKGGLTNPADRTPMAVTMRELLAELEDDERFISAMTPTGDGLVIATHK
ncbi:MAG: methyltransferase [Bifidobacterium sp.]|nr:methyltransferase [Bifidobacterium sp.]